MAAAEPPTAQELNLARTQPPYPTCEELLAAPGQWVRSEYRSTRRLFWTLDGPLETAIAVLDAMPKEGPTTCEPFYDAATGTYHAVAALPVSEPRVSSVTVHVYNLADWEQEWEDLHWEHSEPDGEFPGCAWDMVDGEPRLVLCCEEPRPVNKDASIVVRPAAADGPDGGYVTVLDYVTAVHPWLMGLRSDILGSMRGIYEPLPADTPLALDVPAPEKVWVKTRRIWQVKNNAMSMNVVEGYGGVVRTE